MTLTIALLYIILPLIVLFGVMYLIRRKYDKQAGRPTSKKVKSIKEEESKD